jgi:outer membrane protein TolC
MTVLFGHFNARQENVALVVRSSRSLGIAGGTLLCATVLLSGCASVPGMSAKPNLAAAESYGTSKSFSAPSSAWPTDAWWTAYGDPQLDALIATALRGSPDVAMAAARLDAARAQARAADAALGPAVTLNAQASELKQSYLLGIPPQFVPHGFNTTGALTLNLNWNLDVWGRNRKLLAAATSDAQAAAADAAQARLILSTPRWRNSMRNAMWRSARSRSGRRPSV